MSTLPAGTTTAARVLGLRFNDAARNSRLLAEEHAVYFWNPGRGGGSVIIGADGSYLYASSSVTLDQHLGAFDSGRRTAPDA